MTSSLAHGWAKNGIQFDDITWENTKYEAHHADFLKLVSM